MNYSLSKKKGKYIVLNWKERQLEQCILMNSLDI